MLLEEYADNNPDHPVHAELRDFRRIIFERGGIAKWAKQ